MQEPTYQISRKSDQNCGRDSATVFPTKMAAVTSLFMLMSQNKNPNINILSVKISDSFCKNRLNGFSKIAFLRITHNLCVLKFDRYFNGRFASNTFNMNILVISGS